MTDQADLLATGRFGPKLLAEPPLIAPDHTAGGREDMFGRAVILLQPNNLGPRKVLFKPQDVADFGAAPAIDRLIVISNATDVLVPPGQEAQPEVLRDVGVLIFVDKDEPEPALVLLQQVIVGLKYRHHMQQQVTEIDSVQFQQATLILIV